MDNVANCPNCNALFVKSRFRDVCDKCYKLEEEDFQTVHSFIRKKENRKAEIAEVVEGTGVEEKLIIKFIKTGRLSLAQFPNINYPCSRCGEPTREGDLCDKCVADIQQGLKDHDSAIEHRRQIEEHEKKQRQVTYHAVDDRIRNRR